MGLLVDGQWQDKWYDTARSGGRYERQDSQFLGQLSADGSTPFPAEAGRYHLYVSLACPWAHRTLIFRQLKGLVPMVSLSVVNPLMGAEGWTFEPAPGVIADEVNGARRLYEIYQRADPSYTGRVTVPVLWDRRTGTIVNNESAQIIRIFNSAFDDLGAEPGDYYPLELRGRIDELNAWIYASVNNGVYRAGFATTQLAYEEAVTALFASLDRLEQLLGEHRYLCGGLITEADWRLFTTLLRFDPVYVGHFKCNLRRIADYANLSGYLRDLYQQPGIAQTVNLDHIKTHYYASHNMINPTGVIPLGPVLDYAAPHDRAARFG